MITRQVIQTIYKKYSGRPASPDCLDMPLLFDCAGHHNIKIDMDGPADMLTINSIDPKSPFHSIPLDRVHAIIPFEKWVAVVLQASIIFLNRSSTEVNIDIRIDKPTIAEKIKNLFSKE